MPTQSSRTEDAAKLAEYIRLNPQAIHGSPEELARDAQVDAEVVRRTIRRAAIIAPVVDIAPPPRQVHVPKPSFGFVAKTWNSFMRDPAIVVAITLGLFLAINFTFSNSGSITNLRGLYL
jgi:hypothetical protein